MFKTNRELSLKTLQKVARLSDLSSMQSIYDDCSQRLTPVVPYPTPAGYSNHYRSACKNASSSRGT